ncbi:YkvA family protein [uncultured Pantoea sp.]|uniref:YkvA family protein n=1 Tax=uncultured Pantoea sp. TaxID=218084 RepID=UPI0025D87A5B|nr:YkvA family protein [uncultured Pantoea sp.]
MIVSRLRRWATLIKRDVFVLGVAFRDPRTPWWNKLGMLGLVAYGISPIDLIPDVIPFVGLLDDAVIIPTGVMLLLRLLPKEVRISSLARAETQRSRGKKIAGWLVAMGLIWLALIVYLVRQSLS